MSLACTSLSLWKTWSLGVDCWACMSGVMFSKHQLTQQLQKQVHGKVYRDLIEHIDLTAAHGPWWWAVEFELITTNVTWGKHWVSSREKPVSDCWHVMQEFVMKPVTIKLGTNELCSKFRSSLLKNTSSNSIVPGRLRKLRHLPLIELWLFHDATKRLARVLYTSLVRRGCLLPILIVSRDLNWNHVSEAAVFEQKSYFFNENRSDMSMHSRILRLPMDKLVGIQKLTFFILTLEQKTSLVHGTRGRDVPRYFEWLIIFFRATHIAQINGASSHETLSQNAAVW